MTSAARVFYTGLFCVAIVGQAFAQSEVRQEEYTAQAPGPLAKDSPKYELKYKFAPAETIRYEVVQLATVETSMSGVTSTAQTVSKSVKLWRVKAATPQGITFEHSVESVDMRNSMSGRQEVRYNSVTDAVPPPGYEDVAKDVGVLLTVVTISPSGVLLDREDKRHRPGASSNSQFVPPLPTEPAEVGHVWTIPQDVTVSLEDGSVKKIKTRQRFELLSVADGIATIEIQTQVLTPINDPKIDVQLMQRLSKGTLKFDIQRGRLVQQQLDLDQRVFGFSGGDSSMHWVTQFTEKLLDDQGKPVEEAETPKAAAKTKPGSRLRR